MAQIPASRALASWTAAALISLTAQAAIAQTTTTKTATTAATVYLAAPPLGAPRADDAPPPQTTPSAGDQGSDASARVPATRDDLTPGAWVVDPAGAPLGQVVEVTKPKRNLPSFVTLQEDGVTVAIPLESVSLAAQGAVASQSRAEVWGPQ